MKVKPMALAVLFWSLLVQSCFGQVNGGRVVRFPVGRSLGSVFIWDEESKLFPSASFAYHLAGRTRYYPEGQGGVTLEAGERLGFWMRNATPGKLAKLCEIGKDISYLRLEGRSIRGRDLAGLAGLKELKILGLADIRLRDIDMKYVNEIKSVEILNLPRAISDEGLKELKGLGSLKALYLTGNKITDEGLRELAGATQLKDVYIYVPEHGDVEFLRDIGRLPGLQYHLTIFFHSYNNRVARYLSGAQSLVYLDVGFCPITRSDLVVFTKLGKLETLDLTDIPIRDDDLACLENMSRLNKLDIGDVGGGSKLTDAGMEHIGKLTQLKELTLPSTITDKGLVKLTGLRNLENLTIKSSAGGITDKGVGCISKMSNLKKLIIFPLHSPKVNYCVLTDKSMEQISKLKNLEYLHLHGTEITDAGFGHFKNLKNMKRMEIGCSKISISGLSEVSKYMPKLQRLTIQPIVQDGSGLDISGLTELREIRLCTPADSNTAISDADLACLQGLKKLETLMLTARIKKRGQTFKEEISDEGMIYLKNLTNLQRLFVAGPNITDQGLSYLRGMKNLSTLHISGTFTDAGLSHLEGLNSLSSLSISSESELSQEALKDLNRKLPRLESKLGNRGQQRGRK